MSCLPAPTGCHPPLHQLTERTHHRDMASRPSRPPRAKPPAIASRVAGTAPPTTRCTASPWSAGPTTGAPATTPPANWPPADQKRTSCVCSNAPSPARCSHTSPRPIDDYSDLQPTRQARNITLTSAATHFGVWPNDISRLERGLKRDDTLANNYRQWLNTQLINAA
jgi:hypothetical protein